MAENQANRVAKKVRTCPKVAKTTVEQKNYYGAAATKPHE